jgi:hypothetical protein
MERLSGVRQVKEANESYIDHNPLSTSTRREMRSAERGEKELNKKAEREFR